MIKLKSNLPTSKPDLLISVSREERDKDEEKAILVTAQQLTKSKATPPEKELNPSVTPAEEEITPPSSPSEQELTTILYNDDKPPLELAGVLTGQDPTEHTTGTDKPNCCCDLL